MLSTGAKITAILTIILIAIIAIFLLGEFSMRFLFTDFKKNYDDIRHFEYEKYSEAAKFRGGSYIPPKEPGTFRILAVGDSFTWGMCIYREKDVWPGVLESILKEKTGKKIEVINLGVQAFTTVNEAELIHRIAWKLEPDLIVLQYTLNDPMPSGKDFKRLLAIEDFFHIRNFFRPQIHNFLEKRSYFYIYLNGKFRDIQTAIYHPYYHKELYKEDFNGWAQCKAALVNIAKESNYMKVPVVFLIFPEFMEGKLTRETYPYTGIHDKVSRMGHLCRFYVIDLLDAFISQGRDFKEWFAKKFDRHPNEAAHRIAAQKAAECIIEYNLLK